MSIETELNGQTYRIGKLDAFKQFHVSRKVAPLIPKLVPAFVALSSGKDAFGDMSKLAEVLAPFADAMADMPDEAAEYVVGTCLSVVQRRQGQSWAPVWSAQGKTIMFDDIDLSTTLPLVVQVIRENLGSFISGLLTGQTQPQQITAA
ncbi:MAG: hypothetical protein KGL90_15435 [Burkholderiales bacterium]|nr:hypothetical protein [Burkholderiales bacterium]